RFGSRLCPLAGDAPDPCGANVMSRDNDWWSRVVIRSTRSPRARSDLEPTGARRRSISRSPQKASVDGDIDRDVANDGAVAPHQRLAAAAQVGLRRGTRCSIAKCCPAEHPCAGTYGVE